MHVSGGGGWDAGGGGWGSNPRPVVIHRQLVEEGNWDGVRVRVRLVSR